MGTEIEITDANPVALLRLSLRIYLAQEIYLKLSIIFGNSQVVDFKF